MNLFLLASSVLVFSGSVLGHGRLVNPPSRASMWRYGFSNPPDYNDNEGFCGGFAVQWGQHGGKCGICGDNWGDAVRLHEAPNRYANGIIVANYQSGQQIDVTVDITANHMGYFTFKLCPAESKIRDPAQDCFDANVLKVLPQNDEKYILPSTETKLYTARVKLPEIECQHCILQWTYTAGNNWGLCEDGHGDLGCGPQEHFRACADISIGGGNTSDTRAQQAVFTTLVQTQAEINSLYEQPQKHQQQQQQVHHQQQQQQGQHQQQQQQGQHQQQQQQGQHQQQQQGERLLGLCRAVGTYARIPGMNAWCLQNCFHLPPYCPPSHCSCI